MSSVKIQTKRCSHAGQRRSVMRRWDSSTIWAVTRSPSAPAFTGGSAGTHFSHATRKGSHIGEPGARVIRTSEVRRPAGFSTDDRDQAHPAAAAALALASTALDLDVPASPAEVELRTPVSFAAGERQTPTVPGLRRVARRQLPLSGSGKGLLHVRDEDVGGHLHDTPFRKPRRAWETSPTSAHRNAACTSTAWRTTPGLPSGKRSKSSMLSTVALSAWRYSRTLAFVVGRMNCRSSSG